MTIVGARKLNEPDVELRQTVNEIAVSEVYRIDCGSFQFMRACGMVKNRKSAKAILASLNIEMRQPHITASALAVMHKAPRKLVAIDSFHGHACSKCNCRFPEIQKHIPKGVSLAQRRRLYLIHREKEFAAHHCSK
jgi:hypothetical protein